MQNKEIMPIVNPHNDETADRDAEKVLQRDADLAILQCETCYAKATCPNYPNKDSLSCTEYQNWRDGIGQERAIAQKREAELLAELKDWKQKEAEWLSQFNNETRLLPEAEDLILQHIAELRGK